MNDESLKIIITDTISEYRKVKVNEINDECPICLDVKSCEIGHFKCKHHLCFGCYKSLNIKTCMICRSE
jgi:hypothetical protein